MTENPTVRHRHDIDGLRGLSVLLVVLFHATGSVPGGFIGVDVFFVISGFLITGILQREMQAGSFSFLAFWERRARRILPASVVMSAVTLVMGWALLLPEDLRQLGVSLMAHVCMVSNIYFLRDTGYFAAGADQKPLLHTWSLAVEEQFYVVIPLLCWVLALWCRHRRREVELRPVFFAVFAGLWGVSLVLSVWMVNVNATMAYFVLPSRAWELLTGSLLACFPKVWQTGAARWSQGAGLLGLALIVGSAFVLRDEYAFPGLLALPPCLGAALLIWSLDPTRPEETRNWARRVLESRWLVGLGLISYSWYLWHWPLLAYWEYLDVSFSKTFSRVVTVLLVLVSLGLAWASWRWVESPFRQRRVAPTRARIFAQAGCALGLLLAAGFYLDKAEGLPERWSEKALRFARAAQEMGVDGQGMTDTFQDILAHRPPAFGNLTKGTPVHVVLWGDSHAHCISPAIDAWCDELGLAGRLAAFSSTAPLLDFSQKGSFGLAERSEPWGQAILAMVREQKIPHVILAGHWRKVARRREAEFGKALLHTVSLLREAGAQAWVLMDVPTQNMVVPRALALHEAMPAIFNDPSEMAVTLEEHRELNAVMESLREPLVKAGAKLLDPATLLTNAQGRTLVSDGDSCLYADVGHHISIAGALYLKRLFEPVFITSEAAR
jgi:peptidoglycan/LPS O-acetylase OafA/YrhL